MTGDVIHSTQYYIKHINGAILANLQCRTGNTPKAIKKKFCFHGNSLFSSPHPLDFNKLVIFSLKNVKQGLRLELRYL